MRSKPGTANTRPLFPQNKYTIPSIEQALDADFTREQVVVRVLELMGYFDDE
ncbi:MAG TPA: hypothetical protein VN282_11250 [Pyrinomonadaceae bacterium]|nr:hypothetical protein [Pyrinomonadaceae bacterium]